MTDSIASTESREDGEANGEHPMNPKRQGHNRADNKAHGIKTRLQV